ncbi:MAG: helix-turn-helix domain-containing protein [Pseudomonadota bacterium]|jgi:excisionase family DNA binding protein|nr:helix-turn-helix domain-containing protein [Pseudomonadota bacterium]
MIQKLYSIPDVQEMLGLGQTKIYELMHAGKLKAVKLGRKTLISKSSIDDFVSNLPSFKNNEEA